MTKVPRFAVDGSPLDKLVRQRVFAKASEKDVLLYLNKVRRIYCSSADDEICAVVKMQVPPDVARQAVSDVVRGGDGVFSSKERSSVVRRFKFNVQEMREWVRLFLSGTLQRFLLFVYCAGRVSSCQRRKRGNKVERVFVVWYVPPSPTRVPSFVKHYEHLGSLANPLIRGNNNNDESSQDQWSFTTSHRVAPIVRGVVREMFDLVWSSVYYYTDAGTGGALYVSVMFAPAKTVKIATQTLMVDARTPWVSFVLERAQQIERDGFFSGKDGAAEPSVFFIVAFSPCEYDVFGVKLGIDESLLCTAAGSGSTSVEASEAGSSS